jgi:hypothetical protein
MELTPLEHSLGKCAQRRALVQIANRIDIGGFTDIDPTRAGAVLSFPILINEAPIGVTARVCNGLTNGLIVTVNGVVATELVRHVARSWVERYGVRGRVVVEVKCATPLGAGAGASSQITAGIVAALARGGYLFFVRRSRPATAAAAELLGGVSDWKVERWRIDRMPARIDSR